MSNAAHVTISTPNAIKTRHVSNLKEARRIALSSLDNSPNGSFAVATCGGTSCAFERRAGQTLPARPVRFSR